MESTEFSQAHGVQPSDCPTRPASPVLRFFAANLRFPTCLSPRALEGLAVVALLFVTGTLLFGRIGSPLLEPEEALYAEVPREMAAADQWLVPLRHGRPYYEKPPLLYWLVMAGYAVFGVHESAARLAPCAAGVGIVLVTFWWGRRAFGLRAGFAAALILSLAPRFLHQTRMLTMDGLLSFWTTSALLLGYEALQTNRSGRARRRCWIASAAASGLGLLTKGPVALILVAVPLFTYRFFHRQNSLTYHSPLTTDHSPLTTHNSSPLSSWLAYAGIALGVALPWYVAMAWREPAFVREFFWKHHVLMRFVHPLHEEPAWFYPMVLLLGMLPWTVLMPSLLKTLASRTGRHDLPPGMRFVLVSFAWCLFFFSVADCKRVGYILPAMPLLALALGYVLDKQLSLAPARTVAHAASVRETRLGRLPQGTGLPLAATLIVLAAAFGATWFAYTWPLLRPERCLVLIVLASGGTVWSVYRSSRQSAAGAWVKCGLITFAVLLMAVHFILPGYYRTFSMRAQVRALTAAAEEPEPAVVCYPHHWDSICFYLGKASVPSYGREERARLIADLQARPQTLLFIKCGRAVNDLLSNLPEGLAFERRGQARTVISGLVAAKHAVGK